ncbi:hypothetical protein [Nocardia crassostreae]|uniref:hypothetical protein n=1 Tax=Nocardia crassostreae TaxID=53428 RepID=UPI000B01887E|nr:hypothetical protein [Nocardia crassostreae]
MCINSLQRAYLALRVGADPTRDGEPDDPLSCCAQDDQRVVVELLAAAGTSG